MSAVLLRRAGRRSLSVASQLLSAQRSMACRASLPAAAEAVASAVSPHCPVVVSGARQQPVPLGGTRGFAAGSGLAGGAFVIRRVPQAAAVPSLPASSDGSPGGSLSGARCVAVAAAPQPPSPGRRLATSATPFCNLAAGGGLSDFDEAPFGHAPSFAASAAGMTSADASESESEDDDVAVAQVCSLFARHGLASAWVLLPIFDFVLGSNASLAARRHRLSCCCLQHASRWSCRAAEWGSRACGSLLPQSATLTISHPWQLLDFLLHLLCLHSLSQVGGSILYGVPRMGRASRSTRKPVAEMEARWIGSASHSGDWSRASTVKPVAESGSTVWAQVCLLVTLFTL